MASTWLVEMVMYFIEIYGIEYARESIYSLIKYERMVIKMADNRNAPFVTWTGSQLGHFLYRIFKCFATTGHFEFTASIE